MAIDTSIYGNIKPIQLDNPLDNYSKLMQVQQAQQTNRLADLMYSEKQRENDQTNALNELYKSAIGSDGKVDQLKLLQGAAAGGLGSKIPSLQKQFLETDKTRADIGHLDAQTGKLKSETTASDFDLRMKKHDQAIKDIAGFDSIDAARASLDAHHAAGDLDDQKYQAVLQTMPTDPTKFQQWQVGMIKGIMAAKDRMAYETPDANNIATNKTSRENNKETNATSRANNAAQLASAAAARAQADRHFQAGQNSPQYMETEGGIVALPKKLTAGQVPTGVPVMGSDGQPLSKPLKAIPATVNTAIIANNQSLSQLDRTIALLEGKDQNGQKGDSSATGVKGYLPQQILNAVDPKGIEARAGVADIGSLKLHDRSGAAVTASESPRLMPFIPLTTDSNETALKKLRRLRQEVATESDAMGQIYSRDQGYKPSPIKPASSSGGIPSGWSVKEH